MKISARNQFKGVIKKIVEGSVNAQVTIEIAAGLNLVAIIARDSVKEMGLAVGSPAYAIIKSSHVLVAVD